MDIDFTEIVKREASTCMNKEAVSWDGIKHGAKFGLSISPLGGMSAFGSNASIISGLKTLSKPEFNKELYERELLDKTYRDSAIGKVFNARGKDDFMSSVAKTAVGAGVLGLVGYGIYSALNDKKKDSKVK